MVNDSVLHIVSLLGLRANDFSDEEHAIMMNKFRVKGEIFSTSFRSLLKNNRKINLLILVASFCFGVFFNWTGGAILLLLSLSLSIYLRKKIAKDLFQKFKENLETENRLIKKSLHERLRDVLRELGREEMSSVIDTIDSPSHLCNVLEKDEGKLLDEMLGENVVLKWQKVSADLLKDEITNKGLKIKLERFWKNNGRDK